MFGRIKNWLSPDKGHLVASNVIVPQSAVDAARSGDSPYDLVQAVINFVNVMMSRGLLKRDEIPLKAMQAYHADYYLAQVNNGGHSQFIHNCGANAAFIWADARAGLRAMAADKHAGVLEEMLSWVEAEPDEASRQNGFEVRAKRLDELDKAFYAAERQAPMIDASARWILAWPELVAADNTEYQNILNRSADMNPLREDRLVSRRIQSIRHQITEWLHLAVGMAATSGSSIEVRLSLGGGTSREIEGETQTAWTVRTNVGTRYAVVTDQWARLYEVQKADNPEMPEIGDTEGWKAAISDGRLARYKGNTVGRRLSHVEAATIASARDLGERHKAAAAIDLLLRAVGYNADSVAVSLVNIDPDADGGSTAYWIAASEKDAYFVRTTEREAMIKKVGDDEGVANRHARAAEIAAHAKRME